MGSRHPRERLALAAAGGLDAAEDRHLREHIQECPSCAWELSQWQELARALRNIPTPQPSPALVTRVKALVELAQAERADERLNRTLLVFTLILSWTLTVLGWMVFNFLSGDRLSSLVLVSSERWVWPALYLAAAWLGGGTAVVLLGLHYRKFRRWA